MISKAVFNCSTRNLWQNAVLWWFFGTWCSIDVGEVTGYMEKVNGSCYSSQCSCYWRVNHGMHGIRVDYLTKSLVQMLSDPRNVIKFLRWREQEVHWFGLGLFILYEKLQRQNSSLSHCRKLSSCSLKLVLSMNYHIWLNLDHNVTQNTVEEEH